MPDIISATTTRQSDLGDDLLEGVPAIAKHLGKTTRAVRWMIDQGHLPVAFRRGGQYFARRSELDTFFSARGPDAARAFFTAAGAFADRVIAHHADRDQIISVLGSGGRIAIDLILPASADADLKAEAAVRLVDRFGKSGVLITTSGRGRTAPAGAQH